MDQTSAQHDLSGVAIAAVDPPAVEQFEPAAPITNRFLYVNVTGLRAKQLRRGAKPRLSEEQLAQLGSARAERIAKEEVRHGLVPYYLPEFRAQWLSA